MTLPYLDPASLEAILSRRFADARFTRLAQLPPPESFLGMDKAAGRIAQAVQGHEAITVVGDYDVDGVVASAIVMTFLEAAGADVTVRLPDRFVDGYGINADIAREIDTPVILTVDNGITALEAAAVCKARGIDLIVTDHHNPKETLPDAFAIINPKQPGCDFPFAEISGAAVAWYLCAAVKKRLGLEHDMGAYLEWLALATIADVMPLVEINRVLVQSGLAALDKSRRPYALALKQALDTPTLDAETLGFQVNPRLNAAGRLEHPMSAYRFLRANDLQEALDAFYYLDGLNQERKALERETTLEAIKMADPARRVLVVAKEGWNEGVIGIVAARLAEKFGKPSVVCAIKEGRAKGSVRSAGGVDVGALVGTQSALLSGFGGHTGAAGLSLLAENLEAFEAGINQAAEALGVEAVEEGKMPLGVLPLHHADGALMALLDRYGPYGEANPVPFFIAPRVQALQAKRLGSDGSHLRLTLAHPGGSHAPRQGVFFNASCDVAPGAMVDVRYTVVRNRFRGNVSVELRIYEVEAEARFS